MKVLKEKRVLWRKKRRFIPLVAYGKNKSTEAAKSVVASIWPNLALGTGIRCQL